MKIASIMYDILNLVSRELGTNGKEGSSTCVSTHLLKIEIVVLLFLKSKYPLKMYTKC